MLHHAWLGMVTSTLLLGTSLDVEADPLQQLPQLRPGLVTDDFHSLHGWSCGPLQLLLQCRDAYLLWDNPGRQTGAYQNPSAGAWDQGQLLAAILGEWSMPACLLGHLYFPAGRPLEMLMAPIIAKLLMASLERAEQL